MEKPMQIVGQFEKRALQTGAVFPFKARILEYVVHLVNDPGTTVSRLAAVIGWNPLLVRSVSATANSAFGFPGRIRDVNLAISMLGSQAVRDAVKNAVASRATRHMANTFHYCQDLWDHSLLCGLVARAIALNTGKADPGKAFVAGLVHDVGFLFLGDDLPSIEAETIRQWGPEHGAGWNTSAQAAGLHEEAGSWMVDRWETLPEDIRDAVRHHHAPTGEEANPSLSAVVHVADVLCHRLFGGPLGRATTVAKSPRAFALLGFPDMAHASADGGALAEIERSIRNRAPALELKVGVLKEGLINTFEDLEPSARFLLALHYFEGISLDGIAGILGISRADVISLHDAALHQMVDVLREMGEWS